MQGVTGSNRVQPPGSLNWKARGISEPRAGRLDGARTTIWVIGSIPPPSPPPAGLLTAVPGRKGDTLGYKVKERPTMAVACLANTPLVATAPLNSTVPLDLTLHNTKSLLLCHCQLIMLVAGQPTGLRCLVRSTRFTRDFTPTRYRRETRDVGRDRA